MEQFAPWAVGLVIALVAGGVGWWRIEKHGALKGELKQAEGERDAAQDDDKIAASPPLTSDESVGVLRRLRARIQGWR
jgi:hypothetical protein